MEIITTTTKVVDWTFENVILSFQTFLEGNYYVVAFLIDICNLISSSISEIITFSYNVIQCYYFDFIYFLNEVNIGMNSIGTIVVNFLYNILLNLYFAFNCIIDTIYNLYVKLTVLSHIISYYITIFSEYCLYFANLIFAAVLLILQLGPNLILLVYHLIIECILYFINCLHVVFYALYNYVISLYYKSQHFIITIPPKAYLGILLLITMYYFRNILLRYIQVIALQYIKGVIKLLNYCLKIYDLMILIIELIKRRLWSSNRNQETGRNYNLGKIMQILKLPIFRKDNREQYSDEKERLMCVVCQDKEKNVLLIPCRHLCMCEDCTATIREAYLGCPLCRKEIFDAVRVYT